MAGYAERSLIVSKTRSKTQEKHAEWMEENWQCVWFSDESKFNLFGSDGKRYCQRRPGEELLEQNVKKTVKHRGSSLQIWGCIGPNGLGWLNRVEGRMNVKQYI